MHRQNLGNVLQYLHPSLFDVSAEFICIRVMVMAIVMVMEMVRVRVGLGLRIFISIATV